MLLSPPLSNFPLVDCISDADKLVVLSFVGTGHHSLKRLVSAPTKDKMDIWSMWKV
jgi:hypothetical protein